MFYYKALIINSLIKQAASINIFVTMVVDMLDFS